jgi:hypothetical protein
VQFKLTQGTPVMVPAIYHPTCTATVHRYYISSSSLSTRRPSSVCRVRHPFASRRGLPAAICSVSANSRGRLLEPACDLGRQLWPLRSAEPAGNYPGWWARAWRRLLLGSNVGPRGRSVELRTSADLRALKSGCCNEDEGQGYQWVQIDLGCCLTLENWLFYRQKGAGVAGARSGRNLPLPCGQTMGLRRGVQLHRWCCI